MFLRGWGGVGGGDGERKIGIFFWWWGGGGEQLLYGWGDMCKGSVVIKCCFIELVKYGGF